MVEAVECRRRWAAGRRGAQAVVGGMGWATGRRGVQAVKVRWSQAQRSRETPAGGVMGQAAQPEQSCGPFGFRLGCLGVRARTFANVRKGKTAGAPADADVVSGHVREQLQ